MQSEQPRERIIECAYKLTYWTCNMDHFIFVFFFSIRWFSLPDSHYHHHQTRCDVQYLLAWPCSHFSMVPTHHTFAWQSLYVFIRAIALFAMYRIFQHQQQKKNKICQFHGIWMKETAFFILITEGVRKSSQNQSNTSNGGLCIYISILS